MMNLLRSFFRIYFRHLVFWFIFFASSVYSQPSSIIPVSELSDSFEAIVGDIKYDIQDAFEGSKINTKTEKMIFDIGNSLHIKSKESSIYDRLLFKKGDKVTKKLLVESERRLRAEKFLADAIISIQIKGDKIIVYVKSFDQFSTSIPISIQKPNNRFIFSIGLLESNLLGYGQSISVFFKQDLDRYGGSLEYHNSSFSFLDLDLFATAVRSNDGFEIATKLSKPLYSRRQKWGFKMEFDLLKEDRFYYLSANDDSIRFQQNNGEKSFIFRYPETKAQEIFISLTRFYGYFYKMNLSFDYKQKLTEVTSEPILNPIYEGNYYDSRGYMYKPEVFQDNLLGLTLEVNNHSYKSLNNYNQLKWKENVKVGYSLSTSIYKNLEFLGTRSSNFFFKHSYSWFNIYKGHIFSTHHNLEYFLNTQSESSSIFSDGIVESDLQYQWKYVFWASTYLSLSWKMLVDKDPSHQLTLGSDNGLKGYPNRFFTGPARFVFQLEERFFPKFEILTTVPVIAFFLNGGDVFSSYEINGTSYEEIDFKELHYSIGLGLRLGLTRSVQRVINHIDIAIPLNSRLMKSFKGFVFSVIAKTSL